MLLHFQQTYYSQFTIWTSSVRWGPPIEFNAGSEYSNTSSVVFELEVLVV